MLCKLRVQRERELAAHEAAIDFFAAHGARDRLALAQAWLSFERGCTQSGVDHCVGLEPPDDAHSEIAIA